MTSRREISIRSKVKEEEEHIDAVLKEANLYEVGQSLEDKRQLFMFITESETMAKQHEAMRNEMKQQESYMMNLCSSDKDAKDSPKQQQEDTEDKCTSDEDLFCEASSSNLKQSTKLSDDMLNNQPSTSSGQVDAYSRCSRSSSLECEPSPTRVDLYSLVSQLDSNNESEQAIQESESLLEPSPEQGHITKRNEDKNLSNVGVDDGAEVEEDDKSNIVDPEDDDETDLEETDKKSVASSINTPAKVNSPVADIIINRRSLVNKSQPKMLTFDKDVHHTPLPRKNMKSELKELAFMKHDTESSEDCVKRILGLIDKQNKLILEWQSTLPIQIGMWGPPLVEDKRLRNSLDKRTSFQHQEQNLSDSDDSTMLCQRITRRQYNKRKSPTLKTTANKKNSSDSDDDFYPPPITRKRNKVTLDKDKNLFNNNICANNESINDSKNLNSTNNDSINTSKNESLRLRYSGDSDEDVILSSQKALENNSPEPASSESELFSKNNKSNLKEDFIKTKDEFDTKLNEISKEFNENVQRESKVARKTFHLTPSKLGVNSKSPNDDSASKESYSSKRKRSDEEEVIEDVSDDDDDTLLFSKKSRSSTEDGEVSSMPSTSKSFDMNVNINKKVVNKNSAKEIRPGPLRFIKQSLKLQADKNTSSVNDLQQQLKKKVEELEEKPDITVLPDKNECKEDLIECPLCQKKFSSTEIEAHASDCNGVVEEEVLEQENKRPTTREKSNASRERGTQESHNNDDDDDDIECITSKPVSKLSNKDHKSFNSEECFYCNAFFPVGDDYLLHVRSCPKKDLLLTDSSPPSTTPRHDTSSARSKKSSVQSGSLFDHIDRQGSRRHLPLRPLDANLHSPARHRSPSPVYESDEYNYPTSPIKSFVPISEQSDSCIDYHNQFKSKHTVTKLKQQLKKRTTKSKRGRRGKRKARK